MAQQTMYVVVAAVVAVVVVAAAVVAAVVAAFFVVAVRISFWIRWSYHLQSRAFREWSIWVSSREGNFWTDWIPRGRFCLCRILVAFPVAVLDEANFWNEILQTFLGRRYHRIRGNANLSVKVDPDDRR